MWSKLDDALIDHHKVFTAGDAIGKNGAAIALGLYAVGLMWTNKHLTDGLLPAVVVKQFQHCADPLKVADALVGAGLWDAGKDGYTVHDFHDHNPAAADVKTTREATRKARSEAGKVGAVRRWAHSKVNGKHVANG
jgi:hypothetical protein